MNSSCDWLPVRPRHQFPASFQLRTFDTRSRPSWLGSEEDRGRALFVSKKIS